ncbi:unnamed protein product [Lactuca virosa]|uniref:DNA-directed DNA polymerase family A palm domain-containing protein n=1 Tax=Lactuca virosa TaxID=75947 RepID=A0AAU9M6T6_9ASTR|nr:unnamed protein product [Lactuca virosa]
MINELLPTTACVCYIACRKDTIRELTYANKTSRQVCRLIYCFNSKYDYIAYIDYVESLDALLLLFRHVHNSCSMKCSHELRVHFYCGSASRSTYCTYSSAASFFLKFPAGLVVPEYIISVARNGCCKRAAQTRALSSVLLKLLTSEKLLEPLVTIEMPLVNVLSDMEVFGIGVDMEGRLKLPVREGYKGKQHPSTDKHCLELLRFEHPIVPVIKEHRTLAKLLNCTLGSICSLSKLSMKTQRYTLHGHWLQTSTATGRLSMEDPNLQCVEHMVEFKIDSNDSDMELYKENWLLVTADYSQIELRLMAHFSKDQSLIDLLTKPLGDVFNMITAKWSGKEESLVGPKGRDQTKRLIYGILYGMGADDARDKIQSFKRSFPGVASWLIDAVAICHKKGYVETLMGRKRFLAKVKFGNSEEKSKASICQGSVADIIKVAMITIHVVIGEGVD